MGRERAICAAAGSTGTMALSVVGRVCNASDEFVTERIKLNVPVQESGMVYISRCLLNLLVSSPEKILHSLIYCIQNEN